LTKKYDFGTLTVVKVTAQEEYGLRCLVHLAAVSIHRPLTVHEISEREGLSVPYVAKLMNPLREAGLVDSVRGRGGGYYLTRPADSISVSEILAALGGQIFEARYCERFPGEGDECVHLGDCSIRSLWGTIEGMVDQVLRRTSLADLMKSEARMGADLHERQRRQLPVLHGHHAAHEAPAAPEVEALEEKE